MLHLPTCEYWPEEPTLRIVVFLVAVCVTLSGRGFCPWAAETGGMSVKSWQQRRISRASRPETLSVPHWGDGGQSGDQVSYWYSVLECGVRGSKQNTSVCEEKTGTATLCNRRQQALWETSCCVFTILIETSVEDLKLTFSWVHVVHTSCDLAAVQLSGAQSDDQNV